MKAKTTTVEGIHLLWETLACPLPPYVDLNRVLRRDEAAKIYIDALDDRNVAGSAADIASEASRYAVLLECWK